MKKTLLTLSATLTAMAAAYAMEPISTDVFVPEDSPMSQTAFRGKVQRERAYAASGTPYLYFGYANLDNVVAYSLGSSAQNRNVVYQAVEFPKEAQEAYKGCRITGMKVVTGTSQGGANLVTKVNGFVTDKLDGIPEFKQAFTLPTTSYTETVLRFTDSYDITGEKDLYFGYSFIFSTNCGCIVSDNNKRTSASNLMCITETFKDEPTAANWLDMSPQVGNLCIMLMVEGDNLPTNIASPKYIYVDPYYSKEKLYYTLVVHNDAANDIESLEIETTTSNGTKSTKTVTLATPIEVDSEGEVDVTGIPNTENGLFGISAKITKVNGVALAEDLQVSVSSQSSTYENGYPRNLVVEEATATGCQFCPAGIVLMEYLKKNYPDRWVRIAVHGNAYGDQIPCATYAPWVNTYVAGFPTAIINRIVEMGFYSDASYNAKVADMYYEFFTKYPAYTKMDLSATCDDSNKFVNVTSNTEFAFDISDEYPHTLSYVVIEDGLGPYNQANAYSGTSAKMDGWETKGNPVSTIYEDVARTLYQFPGIDNSLPTTLEANKPYAHTATIPISNVSHDTFRLVGLVTNSNTGEIVNAAQITVYKAGVEGVVNDSEVSVQGGKGEVIVNGTGLVNVYSLDGRMVGTQNLSSGIYVVVANGKTYKVIVK